MQVPEEERDGGLKGVRAESQLSRHDRGKQVFRWREQGLPGQETDGDTPHLRPPAAGPPGPGSQYFQLSISQLLGLLLQATWLALFVQVPEARDGGGGFLHTTGGSFRVCV